MGQSTLEFALVFPVFLGAFIGLVFFAMLFYSYVTLQLGVRQGASTLVHHPEYTIYAIRSAVCNSGFAFAPGQMYVKVEPPDLASAPAVACSSLGTTDTPTNDPMYNGWQTGIAVGVTAYYTVPLPNVSIPIGATTVVIFKPIQIQAVSIMTFD